MPQVFAVPRGTDFDFPLEVIDPDTEDPYLLVGTEVLTAKVWTGDDQAPLFSPSLLLDRAPGDTAPTANVILRILASATGTLEPGDYKAQGYADDGSSYKALFGADGIILRLTPNPGTAVARTSWITWDQLQRYSEILGINLSARQDQYGFLEQRADATEELKAAILRRALLRPGYTRRRGSAFDYVHGYDVPTAEAPPSKEDISAAMDAGRIQKDIRLIEMLACIAIRRIEGDNLTDEPRNNPYSEHAARCQARYLDVFKGWPATLDMDADATYDVEIKVDATYLGDLP